MIETLRWLAVQFRDRANEDPADHTEQDAQQVEAALKAAEAVERYDQALNELELAPNGDDYNNVLSFLRGQAYKPPHTKNR